MAVIAVAMSGGVDSSVAATILKKKHDIFGVTMLLHKHSEDAIASAANVCKQIGISHYVIDLVVPFKQKIIEMFQYEYQSGRTPNPCCICNRDIKMGLFLKQSLALGADFMATGHYANNTNHHLEEACNKVKDQSYFLSLVDANCLAKVKFPLGCFENKSQIREIASNLKLEVANKPDSQNICFLPNNYKTIMPPSSGKIIHIKTNEVLGKHNGVFNYTVGQRRGLGISYHHSLYVIKIIDNNVYVGESDMLQNGTFIIKDINWLEEQNKQFNALVKIRSSCKKCPAIVTKLSDNIAEITMQSNDHAAIAPGQICAMYNNNYVIGGGIIS